MRMRLLDLLVAGLLLSLPGLSVGFSLSQLPFGLFPFWQGGQRDQGVVAA